MGPEEFYQSPDQSAAKGICQIAAYCRISIDVVAIVSQGDVTNT